MISLLASFLFPPLGAKPSLLLKGEVCPSTMMMKLFSEAEPALSSRGIFYRREATFPDFLFFDAHFEIASLFSLYFAAVAALAFPFAEVGRFFLGLRPGSWTPSPPPSLPLEKFRFLFP